MIHGTGRRVATTVVMVILGSVAWGCGADRPGISCGVPGWSGGVHHLHRATDNHLHGATDHHHRPLHHDDHGSVDHHQAHHDHHQAHHDHHHQTDHQDHVVQDPVGTHRAHRGAGHRHRPGGHPAGGPEEEGRSRPRWRRLVVPALSDAQLARDSLQSANAMSDDPELRASVEVQVERASAALERAVPGAPDLDGRKPGHQRRHCPAGTGLRHRGRPPAAARGLGPDGHPAGPGRRGPPGPRPSN